MIDLRYMGLTLIAVFLALAVGMMTGSALGSPERQAAMFESLRTQFEELRTQNQQVREDSDAVRRRLAARDRSLRELLPLAVRGRLGGSTVGVVLCGAVDERPFWSDLESAIQKAGARIGPIVRIPDQPRVLSTAERQRFSSYWRRDGVGPSVPDALEPAGWVVPALSRSGQEDLLRQLASAAGLELRGDFSAPVRRIVVIAGVPDVGREALVNAGTVPERWVVDAAINEPGVRIVAAEPEETSVSPVEPLKSRGIPTVDNIDTAAGQISAVLALAGADGNFGSKPGATRPIPPLEP